MMIRKSVSTWILVGMTQEVLSLEINYFWKDDRMIPLICQQLVQNNLYNAIPEIW